MSWFGFTDIAKNAISEAQKKIDKVLDIQEESKDEGNHHTNSAVEIIQKQESDGVGEKPITPTSTQFKNTSTGINKSKSTGFGVSLTQTKKSKKTTKLGSKILKQNKPEILPSYEFNESVKALQSSDAFTAQILSVSNEEVKQTNADTNLTLIDNSENNTEITCLSEYNQSNAQSIKPVKDKTSCSPVSTTESSEIDILDNESGTSELSSLKQTDTEVSLQSPVSFISSQLNTHSDIELLPGSGYSSPPNVDDVKLFNDKMSDYISSSETQTPAVGLESNNTDNDFVEGDFVKDDIPKRHEQTITGIEQETGKEIILESEDVEEYKNNNLNFNYQQTHATSVKYHDSHAQVTNTPIETAEDMQNKDFEFLNEKIEAYENKLFNLSKLNAKLSEDNDNFKSEITMLKEEAYHESEMQIQKLEQALSNMENKYHISCEENANLQKQKSLIEANLAARMSNEQVQKVLSEKEESIKGLLEEGEKLSKQHLQQNNLIKKLKTQLKEKESALETVTENLNDITSLKNNLQEELKEVKNSDEEYKSTSIRISNAYKEKEDEILEFKEKFSESEIKMTSLQNNLDSAYLEITELNKKLAEKDSQITAEWSSKEAVLKQFAEMEIKKLSVDYDHQKELLLLQIVDLNNSIQKNDIIASRKNSELKSEIKDFQDRLQQAEIRNQELMLNVANATSPLLRQMENLQTTSAAQQRTWHALEKSLTGRLEEAQMQMAVCQEKERLAESNLLEMKTKLKAAEQHLLAEKEKVAGSEKDIQNLKAEIEGLKHNLNTTKVELQQSHGKHNHLVENLKKEKLSLENQLNMEKVRSEAEQKKFKTQQELWKKEKDKQSWMSRPELHSTASITAPDIESLGSGKDSSNLLDHSIEQGLMFSSSNISSSHSYNDFRMSSSTTLENLQSQIKRHEGELAQLHGEINRLERTRASMAEEIVRLTNENEDFEKALIEVGNVSEKLQATETRYNMMLAMYGQKEEENEELRMDLEDVKSMYKQQINDLLSPKK